MGVEGTATCLGADEPLEEDEELLELEEEDELLDSSSLVSFTTGVGSGLGADLVDEEDELLEVEEEDELDSSSFFSSFGTAGCVAAGCAGFLLLELEELEDEDSSLVAFSVLGFFSSLGASCTTYFWRSANHSAFASAVSANKSQSEYFPSEF